MASFRRFRQQHPRIVRGSLIAAAFAISFAIGLFYASFHGDYGCYATPGASYVAGMRLAPLP